MRFVWLRQNSANTIKIQQAFFHPLALIRFAYNAVFWIFLLPFLTTIIDYGTGFIAFAVIILVRLGANLYANQVIKQPEQFESFPFRSP